MKIPWKVTKRKAVCLASFACLLVGATAVAKQPSAPVGVIQSSAAVTFFGCVNNTTGAIRIVGNTTVCNSSEHKIHWNQKGPRGPQGPQGLQGQQGPEGPTGPQGPAGVSVGYSSIVNEGQLLSVFPGTLIAQTNPVATAGTYFVSASVFFQIDPSDKGGVRCYDTTARNGSPFQFSGSDSAGNQAASITDVITVSAGDSFQLFCFGSVDITDTLNNGGLTAILINNSSDASQKPRRPRRVHPPVAPAADR